MSFILEALRRADSERRTGTNPDLQSVIESPPASLVRRRSPWPAAVGILAAGLGVASLVLWSGGEQQTLPPLVAGVRPAPPIGSPAARSRPPVASTNTTRAAVHDVGQGSRPSQRPAAAAKPSGPQRPAPRPALATVVPTAPVPTPADQTKIAQGQRARGPSAPPVTATARIESPARETGKPRSAPEPVRAEPTAAAAARTEPPPPQPPAERTDLAAAQQGTAPPPVPAETPPTDQVPLLESLPAAQHQLFDGIQLDAHVYADDPAKRFVLIRMRGHRVGDTVGTAGPVIEAITRDGAILRSGSVRALIPHP